MPNPVITKAIDRLMGRHDLSAPGQAHQLHALAAAAGHPVLVGRGALAEARRGDGEHELLLGLEVVEAILRQGCRNRLLVARRSWG